MEKLLDRKLQALKANPDAPAFIIADAKDADMAFGIGAPGRSPEAHTGELHYRSMTEFREIIREIVRQELVDIMLMSVSVSDVLAVRERLFETSAVTPAVRANDTTDIHVVRAGRYAAEPSQPFRSALLDHAQCGHIDCAPDERHLGANLGLYSVTFNNQLERDRETLQAYAEFRAEAERKGFRHFLEVFDPNLPHAVAPEQLAAFVNDMIVRTLAGVAESGRPLFLKMVYHGPQAIAELRNYDPGLVVGILGGAAGTTYDAFKLIAEAQRHGARVALFGRKINNAENQFAFLRFLRLIVDGEVTAEEAVRAYHAVLEKLGLRPHRPLDEDLRLTATSMSYLHQAAGAPVSVAVPALPSASRSGPGVPRRRAAATGLASRNTYTPQRPGDTPDFRRMTPAEKLAYNKAERDRVFGS
jgi:hypothetical protein